jgi:transcriptional regulator with XRE-family HTH domain
MVGMAEDKPETLRTRLRLAMGDGGIIVLVADLSARSRVSQSTIWRILGGRTKGRPDTDTVIALARACGVNVGWLIAGEGSMR